MTQAVLAPYSEPFALLDASGGVAALPWAEVVPLDVSLPQGRLSLGIGVRPARVRLAQLVPVARQIADRLGQLFRADAARNGQPISCGKGCSACCHYAVSVSAAEAHWLWEEISLMDQSQRDELTDRFICASRKILHQWPMQASSDADADRSSELDVQHGLRLFADWYSQLEMPCPLLSPRTNTCRTYSNRPLACREHWVISDAALCGDRPAQAVGLDLPLSVASCL